MKMIEKQYRFRIGGTLTCRNEKDGVDQLENAIIGHVNDSKITRSSLEEIDRR